MASKEEANEPLNYQTWVLKVSIHCEGCKKKVKKILRNINGVHSIDIDLQQNKVTVTGDVDADALIQKLAKSGKHANMWPEKKATNPNSSPSSNPKAKDKEKESETTSETKKKNLPAADVVAATDKTPAGTASEPDTKPPEKSKKSADTEAPKPEEEQADTDSETDTKPAETSAKATNTGKKNRKKQGESSSSSSAVATEGHSGNLPHDQPYPVYQGPVYQHPAYAVSHNTAHPMSSHSYYYTPVPPVPLSYTHPGHPYWGYNYNHPPLSQQSEYYPPVNYNHYSSGNHHYGSSMESSPSQSHSYAYYESRELSQSYSYYESMEPRASPSHSYSTQGGLDMFSDENANGCSVM